MLPLRGAHSTCSRTSSQDDILIYNLLTDFALIYRSGNTDVHHLGVYLLRLKAWYIINPWASPWVLKQNGY
jgi:hypothetical protein